MNILMLAVTAFLGGFSGAIVPGSLMTLVINYSLVRGFWAGFRTIVGHAALEIILLVILIFGGADFFSMPVFIIAISLCGSLVLVFMGYGMIKDSKNDTMEFVVPGNKLSGRITRFPEIAGALVSITNPYWILWWATIGITYLSIAKSNGVGDFLAFYLGHISADFAWYSFLGILLVTG